MRIQVEYDELIRILEEYVEGFNDCACCPAYFMCQKENEHFREIDSYECSRYIRDRYLRATN